MIVLINDSAEAITLLKLLSVCSRHSCVMQDGTVDSQRSSTRPLGARPNNFLVEKTGLRLLPLNNLGFVLYLLKKFHLRSRKFLFHDMINFNNLPEGTRF